jgi:3-oxoacyl-[acyl-carrier-protein] synthase II
VSRTVVITGVGAVTPLGVGAQTMHERWIDGNSGLRDGLGRCEEFDPSTAMSRKEQRRAARFTQLAVAAGQEALAQAGWSTGPPYEAERVGCIIGTGIGGLEMTEDQHSCLQTSGQRGLTAVGVPMMMPNAAAASVAIRHGLHGPSWGVVSACAAGAHAIGTAVKLLQAGVVDAVVAGGAEAALTPVAIGGFAHMGATSRTGLSCPFDARRDGFVAGEGAGVLVLEDGESARARGARALGEILGYAATSDAYHLTAPQPGGTSAARAITLALEDADLQPRDLAYINAHGTSTPLNDRSETEALKTALGPDAQRIPVSSLKSATGHLLGAGGAVEAIATLLALRARVAPPTLNWEQPEDGLDLDYVPCCAKPLTGPEDETGRSAGISNSFGFGGHNAVICIAAKGEL